MRERGHIARVNIGLCFPEMDRSEQEKLWRDSFDSIGVFAVRIRPWLVGRTARSRSAHADRRPAAPARRLGPRQGRDSGIGAPDHSGILQQDALPSPAGGRHVPAVRQPRALNGACATAACGTAPACFRAMRTAPGAAAPEIGRHPVVRAGPGNPARRQRVRAVLRPPGLEPDLDPPAGQAQRRGSAAVLP